MKGMAVEEGSRKLNRRKRNRHVLLLELGCWRRLFRMDRLHMLDLLHMFGNCFFISSNKKAEGSMTHFAI